MDEKAKFNVQHNFKNIIDVEEKEEEVDEKN